MARSGGDGGRDLIVNIDGNPEGFDRAALSAKESASVFERELEKLERAQLLQEESLKRAASATEAYGRKQDEAALSARRLGLAAEEAGAKADASQRAAADGADKLAKGSITAEQAAQLEAKALRDVERAAIAAAVAQRAEAKATDEQAKASIEQAKREEDAARAAIDAGAREMLAHLRAQGSIQAHNAMLQHLREKYQGFGQDIQEMQTLSQRAFSALSKGATDAANSITTAAGDAAESGPLIFYGIIAGLALLGPLATAVAGTITLGLGGALALLGVMAVRGLAPVKSAFSDLKDTVTTDLANIAKPFEGTLVEIARVAKTTFQGLEPVLTSVFAEMAPRVATFADQLGHALLGLRPAISAIGTGFDQLLAHLGPELPTIMNNVGTAIAAMAQAAGDHAQEFTQLALGVSYVVRYLGDMIGMATKVAPFVAPLTGLLDDIGIGGQTAASGLGTTTNAFTDLGSAADEAEKEVSALDDAIKRILDPSLAVYNDTTRLSEGMRKLTQDLKNSKGALDGQTQTIDASRASFGEAIKLTATLAGDQAKMDGDTRRATGTVAAQLPVLWALAGNSKAAQDQVRALAKAFGIDIPDSTRAGKAGVDAVKKAIDAVHSKTVTISADVSSAEAAIEHMRELAGQPLPPAHFSHGGYVGAFAAGGLPGYPGGGQFHGAGSDTSDSNLIAISNDEFIVNAAATRKYLPLLEMINAGGPHAPSGSPVPAMAMAAAPRAAAAAGVMRLEIVSGGSRFDDALVEIIRTAVRGRGGNVQSALGSS